MCASEGRNRGIQPPYKDVILGMGNLLFRNEGIGVHVIQALKEEPCLQNAELELIDGATSPDVFLLLKDTDRVVVIDAVEASGEPGAIYRFRPEDLEELEKEVGISAHQTSLVDNLKLTQQLGQGPKNVVIIGIQPKDKSWGLELSVELQQRIPEIIEVVLKEVGMDHLDKPEKGQ